MALSTDLTGQLEGVYHLLLPALDLLESIPALESHLEIEAYNLEDLFISRLEALELFVSVDLGFALDDQLDFFVLIVDRVGQELRIFVSVLNVLRHVKARLDLTGLICYGIDHLARLDHEPLVEQRAVRAFFNSLNTLGVLVRQHEDGDGLRDNEVLELSHCEHDDVHDVIILLHQVEHRQQLLDLYLVDLVGMGGHARHYRRATFAAVEPLLAQLRQASLPHACLRLHVLASVEVVQHIQSGSSLFLGRQVLKHLPVALKGDSELTVLSLQILHFSLGVVLFLLAVLQIGLGLLDFLLDVGQEQILVERVDLTNVAFSALSRLGSSSEAFDETCLRSPKQIG